MSIAIVTDSTADLPIALLQKHHIQVVPAMLIIDGQSFQDGNGISREDFYHSLSGYKHPPTTSAPPIDLFQQVYAKLIEEGATQVISIHVSSAFSGIYGIACAAAQSFKGVIQVVDSGQVTLGLGFQVLAAAEAASRGCSIDDIRKKLALLSDKIRFIALLDTLENLRRSGRVHWAAAAVGNFLNLRVMIEITKGQVHRLGLFYNRQQGLTNLKKRLFDLGNLDQLAIVYTQLANPADIQHILEFVTNHLNTDAIISPVTTVIGTHVGANGIGFIAVQS